MDVFGEGRGVGSGPDRQMITAWLREHIADLAGSDPDDIDCSAAFSAFGITSVQAVGLSGELCELLGADLPESLLYDHPSIDRLAAALSGGAESTTPVDISPTTVAVESSGNDDPVCVIGMAGIFPAANSVTEFWANLLDGVDAGTEIPADRWDSTRYTNTDPDVAGTCYTNRGAFVDDIAGFDAEYFGISPREAVQMDPQQRMLLQTCARALADAGIAGGDTGPAKTGIYVGMMATSQYQSVLLEALGDSALDDPYFGLGTSPSVAAGRISYLLNLHGPSMVIDTACSSSLLAVHLAAADIDRGTCDTAIAGGVSATLHRDAFRQACKMRMLAADGRNKTFDDAADGFLLGEGCGAVVLQKMSVARARGHQILAVIRGSAVNQDGRTNGLTAPSGSAQVDVIRQAHARAGVTPRQIAFHEAHGSGTLLGDSIEMAAITEVFGGSRAADSPLPVGAVKSGIGHLTGASGIAGLIKTILVLRHRQVPPNLNLNNPSRSIDWDRAPVILPDRPLPLPAGDLFAGISSFGWSGTNVHLVIAGPPERASLAPKSGWQVLPLSGKSRPALATQVRDYVERLAAADLNPADIAFTTQWGRDVHRHRAAVAFRTVPELLQRLEKLDDRSFRDNPGNESRPVAFLLPGTGDQYPRMGAALYRQEPAFRAAIDDCALVADPLLGRSLVDVLFPAANEGAGPAAGLLAAMGRGAGATEDPTPPIEVAHTTAFVLAVAAAQLWRSRGLEPVAVIGYSLGEYAAAWAAGVLSLPDAIRLVIARARLIAGAPAGAMLTVGCPADRLIGQLGQDLSLAAVNGPQNCVVAGPASAVRELQNKLNGQGMVHRLIPTSRAMHSRMLEPIRADLERLVAGFELRPPRIPLLSNVTGTELTAEQATDPAYWADHLCSTVRFSDGILALSEGFAGCLVDLGAGQLGSLALQTLTGRGAAVTVVPTMSTAMDPADDDQVVAAGTARLWSSGVTIRWPRPAGASMVSLPPHPLRPRRFWPEPHPAAASTDRIAPATRPLQQRTAPAAPQILQSCWQREPAGAPGEPIGPLLIFAAEDGPAALLAGAVAEQFGARDDVVTVVPGAQFSRDEAGRYTIRRDAGSGDHEALFADLEQRHLLPAAIAHLWLVDGNAGSATDPQVIAEEKTNGFDSVMAIGRALGGRATGGTRLVVVTDGSQPVTASDDIHPGKATVTGAVLCLPQEFPGIGVRTVDLPCEPGDPDASIAAAQVALELGWPGTAGAVAYRAGERWVEQHREVSLTAAADRPGLRDDGVYLITGGFGALGLLMAEYIARSVRRPRLVLAGRTPLPDRADWDTVLAAEPAGRPAGMILGVRRLEAAGAVVAPHAVDISDPAAVRELLQAVHSSVGPVNGVIHAAGVTDPRMFEPAQLLTASSVTEHFAGKVFGTAALSAALADEPLDFALLQSSMSSILGGLGFAAYAAANAFQERFVTAGGLRPAGTWRAACWDTWQSTVDAGRTEGIGDSLARYTIPADQGLDVLTRFLQSGQRRIVVSAGQLEQRRREWVPGNDPLATISAASVASPTGTTTATRQDYERRLQPLWCAALGVESVGVTESLFDLGGNSLIGMQLVGSIGKEFGRQIPGLALFEAPSITAMADYLLGLDGPSQFTQARENSVDAGDLAPAVEVDVGDSDIAIVGMAGRWPGATTVEQFWDNLRGGVESIRFFTDDELIDAGVPRHELSKPNYVKARPVLDGVGDFDAEFFGFTPFEATLADPQQRLFLEIAWEALENAGYAPRSTQQRVGVFAGSNISTYLLRNLSQDPDIAESANDYQVVISNDKDSLPLSASYKLNLRGPSISVQTFCSTGLVAAHLACRSILDGDCDMAIAGGVSVRVPDQVGHLFEPGGMESPDGHVRTFDAAARGSIFGDGAAVVVLKRLRDALADGDSVVAVIKGSAVNNDGSMKVGFTAPSISGQAAVITAALGNAGVDPASVGYVEAHGTATELGDPIEMAALTRAFGPGLVSASCLIGSVKTNVGHLDRAAGSTGLIKIALALRDRQIPPSLHFTEPNPQIDFDAGPFRVCTELTAWTPRGGAPRRAGINSLGMGGTNAHMVLQEPPELPAPMPQDGSGRQVIVLSARSADALDEATTNLCKHLAGHPDVRLIDVAHTLQVGRERFEYRRAVVAGSAAEAIEELSGASAGRLVEVVERATDLPVTVVLAPGGVDRAGIDALRAGAELFSATIDDCVEAARRCGDSGFAGWLAGEGPEAGPRAALVDFAVQLGVLRQLQQWGISVREVLAIGAGTLARDCFTERLRLDAAVAELLRGKPNGSTEVAVLQHLSGSVDHLLLVIGGSPELLAELNAGSRAVPLLARSEDGSGAGADRSLLRVAAQLWANGADIAWPRTRSVLARRIPLPTYPFQRQRYWVDPPAAGAAQAVLDPDAIRRHPVRALSSIPVRPEAQWFSVPTWKQLAPSRILPVPAGSRSLIFADDDDRTAALAATLRDRGVDVITVRTADRFAEVTPELLTVNPAEPGDHRALLTTLAGRGWAPDRIVHALGLDPAGPGRSFFHSLISISTALAETGSAVGEVDILSLSAMDPLGTDDLEPLKALLTGPTRVLPLEHPGLRVRHLDLDPALGDVPAYWSTVADELHAADLEPAVALRGSRRWAPDHQSVEVTAEPDAGSILQPRGVYLITGGLGGLGLGLARLLAEKVNARIVLVGRQALPPADQWADIITDPHSPRDLVTKLSAVTAIEAAGGEVLTLAADVADARQVEAMLAAARRRFGRIDGVLHAAGSPGVGLTSMKSKASVEQVLGAKVDGTEVLLAALTDEPPDVVVLFSSIAAVTGGGPGQLDYCSANAYLGARATQAQRAGTKFPVIAIDWSEWQLNGWQDATNGMGDEIAEFLAVNRSRIGIGMEQGWRSLLRAIELGHPQVTVSTQDPTVLVEVAAALDVTTISGGRQAVGLRHPRPDLPEPYVPATTPLSRVISELWMQALGLDDIGINDNFFDLGGNSLLGIDLITRIRRRLELATLPPQVLYEAPTIAELAAYLGAAGEDDGELDASASRGARRRNIARGARS